eukprot:CAMPEP_0115151082 /NCGR_PEP_ID=MMETSP0227-20121206/65400_1 /TAXON_ID=89957 /ORGANISM="Polarella glacialis, Strain CCMP 1383" /LENGTH=263 /DNA_ID=CAMNT_0002561525 /DNA_START=183 /DNA_END=971 /DNA_ORIENTATION=+
MKQVSALLPARRQSYPVSLRSSVLEIRAWHLDPPTARRSQRARCAEAAHDFLLLLCELHSLLGLVVFQPVHVPPRRRAGFDDGHVGEDHPLRQRRRALLSSQQPASEFRWNSLKSGPDLLPLVGMPSSGAALLAWGRICNGGAALCDGPASGEGPAKLEGWEVASGLRAHNAAGIFRVFASERVRIGVGPVAPAAGAVAAQLKAASVALTLARPPAHYLAGCSSTASVPMEAAMRRILVAAVERTAEAAVLKEAARPAPSPLA